MSNAKFVVPPAINEPVLDFAPGSSERTKLNSALEEMSGTQIEIPLVIGGEEIRTGNTKNSVSPHRHAQVLGTYHCADADAVGKAAQAAAKAAPAWAAMPWEHRASIFLRAAELLAGPFRMPINAATMLGQSKTPRRTKPSSVSSISTDGL